MIEALRSAMVAALDQNKACESSPPERGAFNTNEAATFLGISTVSLWRLEKRGLIKPIKLLRHNIWPRAELGRFLKGSV
jgi:hypothetical protein